MPQAEENIVCQSLYISCKKVTSSVHNLNKCTTAFPQESRGAWVESRGALCGLPFCHPENEKGVHSQSKLY